MKKFKWQITAFADAEYGLPKRTIIIEAFSKSEAKRIAWQTFPEYHEVMINPVEEA